MSPNSSWLPLFPLNAVLFPDGVLPLKVFEPRYVSMLRDCMARDMPFGIVLIRNGGETGAAFEPENVGCLAHISACEFPSPEIMMLRTVGGQRFRISETRMLADRRLEACTELIAADAEIAPSEAHLHCAKALKIVIDDINARERADDGGRLGSRFPRPMRLQSAAWVANRWCELLPIPLQARQKLLELQSAESRLSIVHQYLLQHKIV
ncbi:MAG: ATP-dependent protease La domain protein [Noviherbaspirillum sp.]|nr:ATP-dependent protease La domain protein [Noviherbaspirillum sp.]